MMWSLDATSSRDRRILLNSAALLVAIFKRLFGANQSFLPLRCFMFSFGDLMRCWLLFVSNSLGVRIVRRSVLLAFPILASLAATLFRAFYFGLETVAVLLLTLRLLAITANTGGLGFLLLFLSQLVKERLSQGVSLLVLTVLAGALSWALGPVLQTFAVSFKTFTVLAVAADLFCGTVLLSWHVIFDKSHWVEELLAWIGRFLSAMALEKVFFVARVTTSLLFLLAHHWLKILRLVDSARGRTSLKRHLAY